MNYAQILSIFRLTAEQVLAGVGSFEHGEPSDESFYSNRAIYPFMNLLKVKLQKDYIDRTVRFPVLTLRGMVLDSLDSSPREREALISEVEIKMDQFFSLLKSAYLDSSGHVMPIDLSIVDFDPFYKKNAAITTGFECVFRINTLLDCYDANFNPISPSPFLVFEDGGRLLL